MDIGDGTTSSADVVAYVRAQSEGHLTTITDALRSDRFATWVLGAAAFGPVLALLAYHAWVYAFLCDDAYISFRYVANFVGGDGLVYNVGDPVEGYTNFLWVLQLAAIWVLTGVSPELSAIPLTAVYTVGTCAVVVFLARQSALGRPVLAAWIALVLLATNRTFAVWTTSGLETRQFTFLVVAGLAFASAYRRHPVYALVAGCTLAMAEYARPEGALIAACACAWMLVDMAWRRAIDPHKLLLLVTPLVLLVGAHYLWRYGYYGEWLPNTYHAKHVRSWPDAGLRYFTVVSIETGLYVLVPLVALGVGAALGRARDTGPLLFVGAIALHALYVVRIGGDHFEFRPLDFYWPLIAVIAADGLLVVRGLLERLWARLDPERAPGLTWASSAGVFAVVLAYTTVLQFAQYALAYELRTSHETRKLSVEVTTERYPALALLPGVASLLPAYNAAERWCIDHNVGVRHAEHRTVWRTIDEGWSRYRDLPDGFLPEDATMSIVTAGIIPYILRDVRFIDMLGLTDRFVAHIDVVRPNRERSMAHDRWAPREYVEEHVNIVVDRPQPTREAALARAPYALRVNADLWMPFSSTRPGWVNEAFAGRDLHRRSTSRSEPPPVPAGGRALGRFDEGLDGWVPSGDALEDQPRAGAVAGQQLIGGYFGAGMINTFHPAHGDKSRGSLLSPGFDVPPASTLVFQVGGGAGPDVAVELLDGDEVLASWRGGDAEQLVEVRHDLTLLAGRHLRVRIGDDAVGSWGHILADDFLVVPTASLP